VRRRPKAPPIAGPTEGRAVALPISLCAIAKADMERSPKGDGSTEAAAEVPERAEKLGQKKFIFSLYYPQLPGRAQKLSQRRAPFAIRV